MTSGASVDGGAAATGPAAFQARLQTGIKNLNPGYFALVMATGIVSVAVSADRAPGLSAVLLGLAIVCYLVLAVAYGWRLARSGHISRVIDISASQGHVVPTAIVHHGGTFIANLGVFDPTDGAGDEHVWQLTRQDTLKVRATGVEKVLGLAFRRGQLYALEMSTMGGSPAPDTGAIVRMSSHGPAKAVVSGLSFPTGMTVGPDGAFYVSNNGFGFGAGQGQILRIQL